METPSALHSCIACGNVYNERIADECPVCGHDHGAPEPQEGEA